MQKLKSMLNKDGNVLYLQSKKGTIAGYSDISVYSISYAGTDGFKVTCCQKGLTVVFSTEETETWHTEKYGAKYCYQKLTDDIANDIIGIIN